MNSKTMLITGGAGFIGINSAQYFLERGWEILLLDNFTRSGAIKNVEWLKESYQFEVVKEDLRSREIITDLVKKKRPSVILHLAAQVAVTTSVESPIEDFEVNAHGTLNLLEAVRNHSPETFFIYASTNKVYGHLSGIKIREDKTRYEYARLPHGVDESFGLDFYSPYGCSKGAADQYVVDYCRIYGVATSVFRQSCVYGHRQFGHEDQGWVAWFVIAALLDKPITVYGDGKQIRDLLFVSDLCRAYERAIVKRDAIKGLAFNIGGGASNTLSLIELLAKLRQQIGKAIEVHNGDWRPGDQKVFVSCNTKATSFLDWEPCVDVDEGVSSIIAWTSENLALFK